MILWLLFLSWLQKGNSQDNPTLEILTDTPITYEGESTLTCNYKSTDNQTYPRSISWGFNNTQTQITLSDQTITDKTQTSFNFVMNNSYADNPNGNYFCTVVQSDSERVDSGQITVYFRDFKLEMLSPSSGNDAGNMTVYSGETVRLGLVRMGDANNVSCDIGAVEEDKSVPGAYSYYTSWSFTASALSATVSCTTTFGSGEPILQNKDLIVIEPEWDTWSNYTECATNADAQYACVQERNRTCTNHNQYSTCEGEGVDFQPCEPDQCEPLLKEWSGWSACKYHYSTGQDVCRRTRNRDCVPALNSSSSCNDTEVVEHEQCSKEMCDRWTNWEGWSHCQDISDKCTRFRKRSCDLPYGRKCVGEDVQLAECFPYETFCAPRFKANYQIQISRSYKQEFFLRCDVQPSDESGFVGMKIQWKLDLDVIASYSHVNADTLKYNGQGLTERNEGLYKCCVSNKFGKRCNAGWFLRLSDYGPVLKEEFRHYSAPIDIPIRKRNNFTFTCSLEGYQLNYMWYHGTPSKEILGATSREYTLVNMAKDKQGSYFCCADDTKSSKSLCEPNGYRAFIPANGNTKYIILIISLVLVLAICLLLFVTCVHCNKMNSFKRRFRHVFERSGKLYNGLDTHNNDSQILQRSQSYLKRLSKSKPLSKSELDILVTKINEIPESGGDREYSDNVELGVEYESLPNNFITINRTPVGTEGKNRYLNVLPNPHSRVLLTEENGDPTSTYINANYVRGYKLAPKEYIATQGPIPSTTYDFWRLVWEEKVRTIVMATGLLENNRMKCSLYWPATEEALTMKIGTFEIQQSGLFPSKHYTLAILKLRRLPTEQDTQDLEGEREPEERIIYHFWYHAWPDFGVPHDTGPFLDFVECVRRFREVLEEVPTLVHCSAGIGRTGTFVAVNLGIEQLEDMGKVDPLGYICQLRQDRGGMIQTIDQYTFVHRAIHAYQARISAREESRDTTSRDTKLYIKHGLCTLSDTHPYLPAGINLPVVTDIEGSQVDTEFIKQLTQTLRSVSRYSDSSVSSINNLSIRGSTDSINRLSDTTSNKHSSLKDTSQKPLLKKKSSETAKQKRKSKVKSLFFPLSPKDKSKRLSAASVVSSACDVSNLHPEHRSLSLNNIRPPSRSSSIASSHLSVKLSDQ